MNTLPLQIHSTVPVIGTSDIKKSLSYYIKVLSFLPDFEFGNPVVYAGIKSGNAEIYFSYDSGISNAIAEKKINLKFLFG